MTDTQPTAATPDAYDKDVEYFRAHPDEIGAAWGCPQENPHGAIFDFMTADRDMGGGCGCPSMVKDGSPVDVTAASTLEECIRALDLPSNYQMWRVRLGEDSPQSIIDALPLFAKAQRLGDELIPGRVRPEVPTEA